jgi:hypothetical protein
MLLRRTPFSEGQRSIDMCPVLHQGLHGNNYQILDVHVPTKSDCFQGECSLLHAFGTYRMRMMSILCTNMAGTQFGRVIDIRPVLHQGL